MALINQNVLFDRLQLYIDKKIGGVGDELTSIFDEYGLKLIVANLDQLGLISDNMDELLAIYPVVDEIDTIVNTPGLIDAILEAEQNATKAELEAWESEAEAMTADEYATNSLGQEVMEYTSNGDGTFTPIPTSMESAYSYAVQALASADGLKFQGIWDITGLDTVTEPAAPVPLEDPSNPGNPLPYENGMYWVVEGDSVYDPNGDGNIDPYPTFGPAVSPYRDGDQILYISNPNIPYDPWMKKRDLVNWDRIVGVPLNIRTALSYLGEDYNKMVGNLLVDKVNPIIKLRDPNTTDNVYGAISFDNADTTADYAIIKMKDDGTYTDTKLRITSDALEIISSNSGITWDGNKIWHEGNDGVGSGLDADTLQGKIPTDFINFHTLTDPDLDSITSTCDNAVIGLTTPLFGAVSGSLYVRRNGNSVTQLFHSGNVLTTRLSGDNGSTWSDWKQYGSMTFDGTKLSILLPA